MSSIEQVTFDIPTDPGILVKIREGMQEIEASKIRSKAESELQTAIFNRLAEETKVPNRALRKLATATAEGGVDKMAREVSDIESLYHAINRRMLDDVHEGNVGFASGPKDSEGAGEE